MKSRVLVLTLVCALTSVPAAAQTRPRPAFASPQPRVSISLNGGYQATTTEFDDRFTFELYRETGTTSATYPIDAGVLFDVGGGVRLWRGLGAGVAVSRFVRDGAVSTTSSLPHPFFLQQNREVAGEGDGIERQESGIHVQAQYLLPPIGNVHVTLMGGPSILQVNQTMVIDVNYAEEYPYDTATFTGVDPQGAKGTATGFNAGLDVRWMFSRTIGAGAVVRFTRATVDLDAPNNRTVAVDAGGTQIGVGMRFLF